MKLKPDLVKKIKSYFSAQKDVLAVYLFGSRAAGTSHASSDIDLGILLNHNDRAGFFQREFKARFDLDKMLGSEVDVIVLNDADLFLVQQVLTKGVEVYIRDRKKAEELKWHLLKLSWDFMPVKRILDGAVRRRSSHGRRAA